MATNGPKTGGKKPGGDSHISKNLDKNKGPDKDKDDNGNGNGNRYGGYAGYKGVKKKRAAKLVDHELKQMMQMLRRELRRGRRDMRQQARTVKDEFRDERDSINHTFGQTGAFIGQQNSEIDERFNTATAQSQAAQAALMAQLGGGNAANLGAVDSELARLGMDSGAFTGQLQADQSYATDMANISGANAMANLGAMQSGASSIGNLLLGMNESAKTTSLADARDRKGDQISDIRATGRDWTKDIRQQMLDMKSNRGGMIREMLEQLAQTGWAQYVDQQTLNQSQQQLNMQRRQMQHGFAMDNAARASHGGSAYGSAPGGAGSTSDIIAQWLAGGGGKKGPKKPKYTNGGNSGGGNVWGGQLPGNYPGDPAGYLP